MPPDPAMSMSTCGLCGARFDARSAGCNPSCPLSRNCGLVCCPHCGHGAPREDVGVAGILKRALARRRSS
jgi:transposase